MSDARQIDPGVAFVLAYVALLAVLLAWNAHRFGQLVDRCHAKGGQMIEGDVCIRRSEVIKP